MKDGTEEKIDRQFGKTYLYYINLVIILISIVVGIYVLLQLHHNENLQDQQKIDRALEHTEILEVQKQILQIHDPTLVNKLDNITYPITQSNRPPNNTDIVEAERNASLNIAD